MVDSELVVLVREDGTPVGSASKSEVHQASTPLHLAFSCYLLDDSGRLLVTRRALEKLTWPGVWTNSFCGHPAPGEEFTSAVLRRAETELAAQVTDLRPVLPEFRYRAVDAAGTEENEFCPVFAGRLIGGLDPRPTEVMDWAWVNPGELAVAVARAPFAFSPWLVAQLPALLSAGAFSGGTG